MRKMRKIRNVHTHTKRLLLMVGCIVKGEECARARRIKYVSDFECTKRSEG